MLRILDVIDQVMGTGAPQKRLALESISTQALTHHSERVIASLYANAVTTSAIDRALLSQNFASRVYRDESLHIAKVGMESIANTFSDLKLSASLEGITTDIQKLIGVRSELNTTDALDLTAMLSEGRAALIRVSNNIDVIRENMDKLSPTKIASTLAFPEILGVIVLPQHKDLILPYLDTIGNSSVLRYLDINLTYTQKVMGDLIGLGVIDPSNLSSFFENIVQQIDTINAANLENTTLLSAEEVFGYLPDSFNASRVYYLKKHQMDETVYCYDILMKSSEPYMAHENVYTDVAGVVTSGVLDALDSADILRYCDMLCDAVDRTHEMLNRLSTAIGICEQDNTVLKVVGDSIGHSKSISDAGRNRINDVVVSLSKNKDSTIGLVVEHCRHSIYTCVGMVQYLTDSAKNLVVQDGAILEW